MKYLFGALTCLTSVIALNTPSSKLIGDLTRKYTLEDFSTNYFWKRPTTGLYDIDVDLGLNKDLKGKRIAAIGDLNDDKWLDLVTISQAGDYISVHFF